MLQRLLLFCVTMGALCAALGQSAVPLAVQQGADPEQVNELVLADHILANEGVLDAWGHVSVRDAHHPRRFLLSRAIAPALVTAADIYVYDLDGNAEGNPKAAGYLERFIHAEMYKARPDVMAVVHSHAPEVIPFSVTSVPLRPVIHMAGFLPQIAPVFEIRNTAGTDSDMLISSSERGHALAAAIGHGPVVLLRGHGAVVVAPSLHVVVGRSIYTTVDARAELQAIALGGANVAYLNSEEAAKSADQGGFERGWDYWKSKVKP